MKTKGIKNWEQYLVVSLARRDMKNFREGWTDKDNNLVLVIGDTDYTSNFWNDFCAWFSDDMLENIVTLQEEVQR